MGPTEKAFQDVRAILGKLDTNIDKLRAQRTRGPAPAGTAAAGVSNASNGHERLIGAAQPALQATPAARPAGAPQIAPQPAQPARPPGQYGRATPLPPKQ
jgi:hypothetical protein